MKIFKIFSSVMVVFLSFISYTFAQEENRDKIWSVIETVPMTSKQVLPDFNWTPAEQVPRFYSLASGITAGPNFRPKPTTNSTQSETSIDIHPLNPNIIFGSANTTPYPVTQVYGTGVYWSLDGAINWTGFDIPPFGSNRGDPASVIGTDGKFYENYISSVSGQGVSVSTNNGITWTSYSITPNPGELADKNHYMVDKKPGSPYENRSYCSWTEFGGAYDGQAVIKFSTNFGATWSSIINLSGSLNPGSHAQGVNIQTGPNGEVYVTYAIYDNWPGGEDAIGFSKSTNGGSSWTHARIYSAANFGIRGTLSSKSSIRVSSFPSMAVDRSGGNNNGNIYITWPQRGVAPAGNDPDIVLIRSTNGGTSWTSPVRVNDDPINNGKDQYYSWCTVDQSTGQLLLVFYDSRNVVNSQAEVYMARSLNGGSTIENFKVSDQIHTPAPITGLASGYAGDYIGVAALNDIAYPYWADNRTGIYQGWISKVTFGPPCPVSLPTNPFPAEGALNVSAYLPQISWTNGTGALQTEVWFGIDGNMIKVYDGLSINSWSIPAQLEFNKKYKWQIIGKNDTCSSAGPIWSFTTEPSPAIVFSEEFNNLNCWVAAGPLGTTNWTTQSTNNAGGTSPELRLSWTPEFNGLSKLVSCPVPLLSGRNYSLELKHMLDWFANPAPNIGLGISYDNGITYTPIWSITPTGSVGPQTVTASFSTPPINSPEAVNVKFVFFCNGNSYNIDYWYIDNLVVTDDDYFNVVDPSDVSALPVSSSEILVSFTPNALNNNVVIIWNLTGGFTAPSGTPPSPGQTFAGGTLLYNGTASPVSHTWLNDSTRYYYKVFSYNNLNYSSGVEVNALTPSAILAFQLSVTVYDGWNQLSIPGLHPINQNVETWWAGKDAASVFRFNNGYEPVTAASPGEGYWVKHIGVNIYNTGDEWPADGILLVPHDPIPCNSGWNLIGGYNENAPVSGISTVPPGLLTAQIYKYEHNIGYVIVSSLTPGYGYWVKLSAPGEVILPSGSAAASPSNTNALATKDFGKIIITDASAKSYTLYAVKGEAAPADLSQFDLPPLPPKGMFDIRYSTQRFAERISSIQQGIEITGVTYPLKIKTEDAGIILSDETGKEITRLRTEDEYILSGNFNKVFVSENIIPEEYSLEQNYPNPFNPSTKIEFSLPEKTAVTLTIYNTLGERVVQLVNENLEAGKYSRIWETGSRASGIYIYELRTDKFVSTKKMVLLR